MGTGFMSNVNDTLHRADHAGATLRSPLQPAAADLIHVGSRRWFL
jgi:hypothetical protein